MNIKKKSSQRLPSLRTPWSKLSQTNLHHLFLYKNSNRFLTKMSSLKSSFKDYFFKKVLKSYLNVGNKINNCGYLRLIFDTRFFIFKILHHSKKFYMYLKNLRCTQ